MKARYASLVVLIIVAIAIKIFSLFPATVESVYSNGIYPVIASVQRFLLGWIPFSIGDILYGAAAVYLTIKIVRFAWHFSRRKIRLSDLLIAGRKLLVTALIVYIWFNISWGLNYNRVSVADRFELQTDGLKKEDLLMVINQLANKLHDLDAVSQTNRTAIHRKRYLFDNAVHAYGSLSHSNANFLYRYPSVKPSMYSYLGNYLGFTGYYNPFTGEAQVNTTVPVFVQPFITCHEIGHQLGYAKESEANFAGYLSGRSSDNPIFQYSVYFDMYAYARGYLYRTDSTLLKEIDNKLPIRVQNDFQTLREFYARHNNPVEVVIDKLYSQFLKANQQPSGKISYNEVILLLVGYYKKHGEL
jgi:hypothetical protein